jgi:selenide,water dikinase
MTQLNDLGELLAQTAGITALTDVTGFGLLGHLIEMAEGSGLGAELYYSKVPVIEEARTYLAQRVVPDATYRNWNSYGNHAAFEPGVNVMEAFSLLPDPQTNGGLLFAVTASEVSAVQTKLQQNGLQAFANPVGRFTSKKEKLIQVQA